MLRDTRVFAGLALSALLSVSCSDAPLIVRQANRIVLTEIFSTTE
jgi:hypothetical protein